MLSALISCQPGYRDIGSYPLVLLLTRFPFSSMIAVFRLLVPTAKPSKEFSITLSGLYSLPILFSAG